MLSRTLTPAGTLRTTRLILKRGALPAWFPKGLMQRAESWIVEESEVDVDGKVLTCRTRNLDHVKVMEVIETTHLHEAEDGTTVHKTEARFVSGVGWGLKRRIEEYSASKFKTNIEKSRLGLALVVRLLREARLQLGNRMTQDGNRWNYSDIHAAALEPSSTTPSSSTSTLSSYHSNPINVPNGSREVEPSSSMQRDRSPSSSQSSVNRASNARWWWWSSRD